MQYIYNQFYLYWIFKMSRPLKPGPKPIAKSTGKVDKRRRDNKKTPKNNDDLKPSKSSEK